MHPPFVRKLGIKVIRNRNKTIFSWFLHLAGFFKANDPAVFQFGFLKNRFHTYGCTQSNQKKQKNDKVFMTNCFETAPIHMMQA